MRSPMLIAANAAEAVGEAFDLVSVALHLRRKSGKWPRLDQLVSPFCGLLVIGTELERFCLRDWLHDRLRKGRAAS